MTAVKTCITRKEWPLSESRDESCWRCGPEKHFDRLVYLCLSPKGLLSLGSDQPGVISLKKSRLLGAGHNLVAGVRLRYNIFHQEGKIGKLLAVSRFAAVIDSQSCVVHLGFSPTSRTIYAAAQRCCQSV